MRCWLRGGGRRGGRAVARGLGGEKVDALNDVAVTLRVSVPRGSGSNSLGSRQRVAI